MKPTQVTKILLLVAVLLGMAMSAAAVTFGNESLSYKVKYKWGLINKQAGHATLTLKNDGPNYITQLTAASEPWADKFYCVRDTLNGVIVRRGFKPQFYEKIAHEGSEYKHDTVTFTYNDNNTVTGSCTRYEEKNGKVKRDLKLDLDAEGTTVDMLSAFYYMRSLPYEDWNPGQKKEITIFSGKRKETLTIEYHGISDVESEKKTYTCYHITFIFTSDGGKKTSDDMDAWISADSRRIPIRLEGKLPVGKVHCLYSGE